LAGKVAGAVHELFGSVIDPVSVTFQKTNPQFEGDITLVVFPYVRMAGKSPEQTGQGRVRLMPKRVIERISTESSQLPSSGFTVPSRSLLSLLTVQVGVLPTDSGTGGPAK